MKKNVKKETIVRTVILVLALTNQALNIAGKNPLPFTNEEVASSISMAITTVAALWAWWKNNSFTQKAIVADEVLKGGK